jgi:biotin-[acetyl-CoA-carboxylase] ligase BirA-like protein
MRVYSDDPEKFAGFFPDHADWKRAAPSALPESDARLFSALGCTGPIQETTLIDESEPRFWSRIVAIAEAPWSQYDALQNLLRYENALSGPTACIALTGLGFHGQRGRPWRAESGNLHLSVYLAPDRPVQLLVPGLTMLPAVAVVTAVQKVSHGAVRAGIKWVNDILVDERKVSGVLTATQIKNQTAQSCVLGIGVNVARAPALSPTPFVPKTACLSDYYSVNHGSELPRLFWALLAQLAQHYQQLLTDGPADLFQQYLRASIVIGRKVRIFPEVELQTSADQPLPEPIAQGVVESIAPDLSLKLDTQPQTISHGRLVLC